MTGITGTGGRGAETVRCTSSVECAARTDGKTICGVPSGECVECLHASDCGGGADAGTRDCVANACITYQNCVNSLDCTSGWVCDRTTNHCVPCTVDADCAADGGAQRCIANTCHPACTSDNNCTPLGLLCDTAGGFCATCVKHEDCPANRWCSLGSCALDVCTAGAKRCTTGGLSTCDAVGSAWGSPVACAARQSCSETAAGASCQNWICTPGTLGCASGVEQVLTCSTDGLSTSVNADCGASGQVCVNAACKPVVCEAGKRYCDSKTVRTCSAKGDSSTVYMSCYTTEFCDASTAACKTQVCAPSQPVCNGNVATTCNANGSAYLDGGTDCTTTSQICSAGTCQTQVCTPNARFCQAGVVRTCSSNGLSSSAYQTCTTSQYCDASSVTCKARICTANAAACNGDVATVCNADGSGYVDGGTDCAGAGQLCGAGVCAPSITDTVGSTSSGTSSTYAPRLNVYQVKQNRTLTTIEQYLSATAGTTLTWLVYESTTQTGTYTLIWSGTSTAPGTSGYQSSGVIATPVPLISGRYYAIGAFWGAVSVYYYYGTVTVPASTSFGSLLSSYTGSSTAAPSSISFSTTSSSVYAQRLTTEPAS